MQKPTLARVLSDGLGCFGGLAEGWAQAQARRNGQ